MNTTWSHLAVRPLTRPLLYLGVKPNQVTMAHLTLGLVVLICIAVGSAEVRLWAGLGWLLSCLLDRLDGELARVGDMCSPEGHRLDYLTDMWLSALFFVALGFSVHGAHHEIARILGFLACASQLLSSQVAERFDSLSGDAGKVLGSRWGFDADDALYILGPLGWLPEEWRFGATALAAIGTIGFLLLFASRLRRLRKRML